LQGWPELALKVRTIWALFAMIPLMILALFLGILAVVITSPLITYAAIRGKHLKSPVKNSVGPRG
jgi:multisubunit Na+/H+ antiporter MnhG subunit